MSQHCSIIASHDPTPTHLQEFWDVTELGQDLLRSLLNFDPARRLSAETALKHAWFKERPLPVEPAQLPQVPSTLEYKAKKRKEGYALISFS